MVERPLRMRNVPGSIPGTSNYLFILILNSSDLDFQLIHPIHIKTIFYFVYF